MRNNSEHRFILKGDDKTSAAIKSARSNLGKLDAAFSKINLSVAGIASAIGGGALAVALQRNLNQIDLLAKNADKLGVSTEALTELNYAVSQTSSLTDQQFNMALQRMTRKLGEAELGIGEGRKALELLNISVEDLAKLRPDQQFLAIADAVQKLDDDQKQLAVTAKIFDSDAAAIVTTLQQGSDVIREYRGEARKMGITLTRDQAAKAEAANDALDKLSRAWTGLSNNMAIALAGPFAEFIDWVTESINRVERFVRTIFDLGVNLNKITFVELRAELAETTYEIAQLEKRINQPNLAPRVKRGLNLQLEQLTERAENYKKKLEELTKSQTDYDGALGGYSYLGNNTPALLPDPKNPKPQKNDDPQEQRLTALQRFVKESQDTATQFDQTWANTLNRFTGSVGQAFGTAATSQETLADGLKRSLVTVTNQTISSLATIAAKKVAIMALEKAGIISTAAVSKGAAAGTAAAWSGPAAMVSLATGGANAVTASSTIPLLVASITSAMAGFKGQMHGGGLVPSTGTYFLEGGESVTSKRHTQKLSQALDRGGIGGGDTFNISLNLNAIDSKTGSEFIIKNEPAITAVIQRAFNARGIRGPLG